MFLAIILGIIIICLIIKASGSQAPLKPNQTMIDINVPHPERCQDKTMINFIADTPNYKLEPVFKQYAQLGYFLKPLYLDAYFEKIDKRYIDKNEYSQPNDFHIELRNPEENIATPSKTTKPKKTNITTDDILRFKTNKIESEWLKPQKQLEDKSHEFYGKKVVITGTFQNFPYRNEIAYLLWSVGADVDTAMSPRIDVVVLGQDPGWRKIEEIDKYQPHVIDEALFLEMFPDYQPKYI